MPPEIDSTTGNPSFQPYSIEQGLVKLQDEAHAIPIAVLKPGKTKALAEPAPILASSPPRVDDIVATVLSSAASPSMIDQGQSIADDVEQQDIANIVRFSLEEIESWDSYPDDFAEEAEAFF